MPTPVGSRVGAILDTTVPSCNFFGYGVYEGDFQIDPNAGGMAPAMWEAYNDPEIVARLSEEARAAVLLNPRIRLDNGDVVWGCECWWGPEDQVRKRIEGLKIVMVRIEDARKGE